MSDTYRSEAEALADALPPYAASFDLPGGESTSAALRRAEAEIERLRGNEKRWAAEFEHAETELRATRAELRERVNLRAFELAARDTGEPAEPSQLSIDVDTATPDDLRAEVRRLDRKLRWAYTHYDDQVTTNLLAAYGLTDQRDEARAEVERLRRRIAEAVHEAGRDQAEARHEVERLTASLDARNRALVRARAQIGELIAQATSRHGTTLCPRCGKALAAEVDAEKENDDG